MIDKKEVILSAQALGYFRAKSEAKKDAALSELLELEQFSEHADECRAILEAETERRHNVSQARARKALERIEAEAAKPLTGGTDSADAHISDYPPGLYVVTVAQNNTDIDRPFFDALKGYCAANDARLLVARMTYNKSGFQQAQDAEGVYYAPELSAFFVDGQIRLGGVIDFCAQANVLPTAKNPLSGFEAITGPGIDVIIPASKIALKCTAALNGAKGKNLYSTGSATKRNYILRKAGAVAATEHNIGALVVDTRNGSAIVRQLERMPQSSGFYDLDRFYHADGSVSIARPIALQFGDIHAEKMEERNLAACVALIEQYRPDHVFLHDVLDFSSRNHHNIKDCTFMHAQHVKGESVAGDLRKMARIIDTLALAADGNFGGHVVHIVESNHDLAINTWLKNADFKTDPLNALTYLRCMTALYEHQQQTPDAAFNMLRFAYSAIGRGTLADVIAFHETDESVILAGVEMGCHGHTGINGSRGSPQQFRTLGIPMNTGHTHTPSINGACYTAGVTGSLNMGYNVGPSSWRLANVFTYENGQRQIVFM